MKNADRLENTQKDTTAHKRRMRQRELSNLVRNSSTRKSGANL